MKFRLEHRFDAPVAAVEAAVLDGPALTAMLARELPAIAAVELLSQKDDGTVVRREVRYTPRSRIPAFAERWITPEMTCWVEVSRYDRASRRFEYEIHPDIPARFRDRFESRGEYRLFEQAGGKTGRIVEGFVTIRAGLLSGMAERFLVGEVKQTFDHEARALARFVAARGARP